MAFFAVPDMDCLVECIDGSNKYPVTTPADILAGQYAQEYH